MSSHAAPSRCRFAPPRVQMSLAVAVTPSEVGEPANPTRSVFSLPRPELLECVSATVTDI